MKPVWFTLHVLHTLNKIYQFKVKILVAITNFNIFLPISFLSSVCNGMQQFPPSSVGIFPLNAHLFTLNVHVCGKKVSEYFVYSGIFFEISNKMQLNVPWQLQSSSTTQNNNKGWGIATGTVKLIYQIRHILRNDFRVGFFLGA